MTEDYIKEKEQETETMADALLRATRELLEESNGENPPS